MSWVCLLYPFYCTATEKEHIASQISVLRNKFVRRFFCAKEGASYDESSRGRD